MTGRHMLKALHERLAASHQQQSAFHADAADCLSAMSECMGKADLSDDDAQEHLENFAARHREQTTFHKGEAAYHRGQADSLNDASKSVSLDDLEKIVPLPTGVRAIPIIRPGQPDIRTSTTAIDPAFAKMLGFDDEEQ